MQLLELKEEATRKAYVRLVKAQEQFNQIMKKHEQLVSYRKEYMLQLETLGTQGAFAVQLRNRMNFIMNLDTGLVQLNSQLAQLAKVRNKEELNYREAKLAEEAVKKLIDRVKQAEESKLQRMQQKESDEYAQKQWYSKNIHDQ